VQTVSHRQRELIGKLELIGGVEFGLDLDRFDRRTGVDWICRVRERESGLYCSAITDWTTALSGSSVTMPPLTRRGESGELPDMSGTQDATKGIARALDEQDIGPCPRVGGRSRRGITGQNGSAHSLICVPVTRQMPPLDLCERPRHLPNPQDWDRLASARAAHCSVLALKIRVWWSHDSASSWDLSHSVQRP
jgi:hypothetical protein